MRWRIGMLALLAGLALANAGRADLCARCGLLVFTLDGGACVECREPTAARSFALCASCASCGTRGARCQACRGGLSPVRGAARGTAPRRAGDASVVIDRSANGQTVVVRVGQTLVFRPEGNAPTGWVWMVTGVAGKALERAGVTRYTQALDDKERRAAAGRYLIRFEAAKPGQSVVLLEYRRPSDTDMRQSRRGFAVRVIVRARGDGPPDGTLARVEPADPAGR